MTKLKVLKEIKESIDKSIIPYDVEGAKIASEVTSKYDPILAPTYNNIKSTIHRYKNKKFPKEPKNINDISNDPIYSAFLKTKRFTEFIRYIDEDICLCISDSQLEIFSNSNELFIDGTFKAVPKFYKQLVIILGYIKEYDATFAICFCFLKNKTYEIYSKFFDKLTEIVYTKDLKIITQKIHCDFELALVKAIRNAFNGQIEIKYCFYHYYKNITKNFKKYKPTNKKSIYIYLLTLVLPFIEPNYVSNVFNKLVKDNYTDEIKDFILYYQNYYLKENTFIEKWNYFGKKINRTNNYCESYNNKINRYINRNKDF